MATPRAARQWKLVGGSLSLDFVNTVGGRRGALIGVRRQPPDWGVIEERLADYGDLLSWAEASGALPPEAVGRLRSAAAREPARAARVVARAVALREALFRIFAAVARRRSPARDDLHSLNRELRIARTNEQLAAQARAVTWVWAPRPLALDRPLWVVARAASDLLTSDARDRVRQCAGDDCGWVFLDATRNHRRRWCDMRDCGNLAKVRRFRQRARRAARA